MAVAIRNVTGIIFDIQRYSIHDGPGIRTLVFLKGCPLSCKWCCNPEGQTAHPEISFIAAKCVGAKECKGPCAKACPNVALSLSPDGKPRTNRELCQGCGLCAETCLYEARHVSGKKLTIDELMAEVKKDEPFYLSSGGGVTLGGGEPLAQFKFTREFLKRCKESYIDTAIETCGYTPWEHLREVIKFVDTAYYDIKHMDPVKHKELTGVSNSLILKNARRLLSENKTKVIIRVPIIPGCNDSEENIKATAVFVANSSGQTMELLPYHRFGLSKYGQFDREYKMANSQGPSQEDMRRLREIVESAGLHEVSDSA